MHQYTRECYGLIYTPQGVYAMQADSPTMRLAVPDLIREALRCRRGDRRPALIASTLERNHVIEIVVLDAIAQRLFHPRKGRRKTDK